MSAVNLARTLAEVQIIKSFTKTYLANIRNSHYSPSYWSVPPIGHPLLLLFILTQMLSSKAPLTPVTQIFTECLSLPLLLIIIILTTLPHHFQIQSSFTCITSFDFQRKQANGSYYFPLYTHKAPTGVWESISLRHKEGLMDLSGSRVYYSLGPRIYQDLEFTLHCAQVWASFSNLSHTDIFSFESLSYPLLPLPQL